MYDTASVQREKCALYSIVCHSVLYFLTKVCFIFLCMAIEHTCATRHNPPDTGVTIITLADKAVDNVTMEINCN